MSSNYTRMLVRVALSVGLLLLLSACNSSNNTSNNIPSDDPPLSNGLTKEQQEQLPGDCLLTFDSTSTAYCFSAPLRKFTSVNTDGTANWDYSLPGYNDTNNIEGIAIIADSQLCIVADVTTIIGNSLHEISCFTLSGEFIDTVPTLEPLPRLGDAVKPRDPLAINLDNEALLSTSAGGFFYLAGSQYLMSANADSTIRDSWSRSSGFVARVDPQTGTVLAWHSLPSAMVSDMEVENDGLIAVTITDINNNVTRSILLDNTTLATQNSTETSDTLNTFDLPQLMPDVYNTLTGVPLQVIESHLTGLEDTLAVNLEFGEENFCTSFNEGRGCEYSFGPSPTTVDCPASGTAVINTTGNSSWNSPNKFDEKIADWVFNDCTFVQPDTNTEIADLLTINGGWKFTRSTSSSTSIDSESSSSTFDQLSVTFSDASESTATGQLITNTGRVLRSSNSFDYIYGTITDFTSTHLDISDAYFGYLIDNTASGFESDQVSIQYFGPELVGATISSEATTGKPIQINLTESNIRTGYAELRDFYDFVGTMSITAADGSDLKLTALEAPDGLGTELVEYSLISGSTTSIYTLPTASWFLPYQITDN